MRQASLLAAALLLSACASVPAGPAAPGQTGSIASGALNLGDWRTASPEATLAAFQQTVAERYGAGVEIAAATADLRRSEFTCGDAPAQDRGRGDPPAQVCRRTITLDGCTHTWQVHLFDQAGDARLARTRGLYDRRCGNEGLLGGPG
jgi:hypothetical protein